MGNTVTQFPLSIPFRHIIADCDHANWLAKPAERSCNSTTTTCPMRAPLMSIEISSANSAASTAKTVF